MKYKIIPDDIVMNLIEFIDEIQFEAAKTNTPDDLHRINFCNYLISELMNGLDGFDLEDPEDKDILIPIPEELELYELAKKHLKNYTYKDVAAWLTTRSGRKIGPSALHERINRERKNKRDLTNANYYAEKYKEACDKARKI